MTAPESTLSGLQKIIGQSAYTAYAGCCTWLNGVYWIKVLDKLRNGNLLIENLYDIGKITVEQEQMTIEPDLVYPLLRGRDVLRWQAEPSAYLILSQDPETRSGIPEAEMKRQYRKTFAYFKKFEQQLRKRSGYRRYFQPTDPLYSIYNVSAQTIAPYKVVWREQSSEFQASVVISTNKPIVPDHKLMLVSCQSENEAYYLSSLLNSSPCKFLVFSYIISTSTSTHVLGNINIPTFLNQDQTHLKLAELAKQCHHSAVNGDTQSVMQLETQIDLFASKLWRLTSKELKSIQDALQESKKDKKTKVIKSN